jgi:hypothetical protein
MTGSHTDRADAPVKQSSGTDEDRNANDNFDGRTGWTDWRARSMRTKGDIISFIRNGHMSIEKKQK